MYVRSTNSDCKPKLVIVRWLLLCTNKRIFASMSIAMINLQRQQPPLQTNLFSNL